MNGEEQLHPGHHSIRLRNHDYSAADFYFVTICSWQSRCIFGRIWNAQMELSTLGRVVKECWTAIPAHFTHARLHAVVIMPNHVHGIIEIVCQAGAQHAAPLQGMWPVQDRRKIQPSSLSAILRSFKAAVSKHARDQLRWKGELWQRNYFERVLRDGKELAGASRYIAENPMKWQWDRENPETRQVAKTETNGAQHAAPLQRRTCH